jgi:orotate phosphoribosyltransferase
MEVHIITIDEYRGQYKGNNDLARDIKYFKYAKNTKGWQEMAQLLMFDLVQKHKELFKKIDYVYCVHNNTKQTNDRLLYAAKYINKGEIIKRIDMRIKDKTILILDDVIYTGATARKEIMKAANNYPARIIFAAFGISSNYNEKATNDLIELLKEFNLFKK